MAEHIPSLIQLAALINIADAVYRNTETAGDLNLLLNEGSPLDGARYIAYVLNEFKEIEPILASKRMKGGGVQ